MKIHSSNGTVEFSRGCVTSSMSKTSFLSSPLGNDAEPVVENAPFTTYRIAPEIGIGATLLFKEEHLEYLAWGFELPGETASDWSEESEMRRKKLHEEWLFRELGKPPYRFNWGSIVSEYDAKGVSSAIILSYGS